MLFKNIKLYNLRISEEDKTVDLLIPKPPKTPYSGCFCGMYKFELNDNNVKTYLFIEILTSTHLLAPARPYMHAA